MGMEKHQAEAVRLREEIEELVRQARNLLNGKKAPRAGAPPIQACDKRTQRESQLEDALEKANWYRQEIKRLRREYEGRDKLGGGPNNPRDKDPMEVQNLLAEKRKELSDLCKVGEGLDRIADAQKRAEAAQNALSPEVAERLARMKDDVEQQKRLHVKLMAERQKLADKRAAVEADVRSAGSQLRQKAAQLQKPSGNVDCDPQRLKQLQRDADILKEAVRQDERKYSMAQKEDEQQLDGFQSQIADLKEAIARQEEVVSRLRSKLKDPHAPGALLHGPTSPGSAVADSDVVTTPMSADVGSPLG